MFIATAAKPTTQLRRSEMSRKHLWAGKNITLLRS